MAPITRKCIVFFTIACMSIPLTANATNGYFLIGFGAKSRAMGGTGIANPVDAMAAAANPAGMSESGTTIDLGAELFSPPRSVAASDGEFDFQTPTKDSASVRREKSGSNLFLIPSMGGSYKFNRKMTIGMAVIGAGANTRYSNNFFELTGVPPNDPYFTLGVNLIQMQMLPTVAYKLNKNHAIGLSFAIGVQTFRAYGLGNFGTPNSDADFEFSQDDSNLTNRGNDWSYGFGLRTGWLGNFFKKKLNVGAYYASRVYMSKFDKYKGLFAEQGSFDIPEHFGVGLALKPTSNITFAFDVQKIMYSNVKSVGNRHPTNSLQDPCTRPNDFAGACTTPGATATPSSKALGANDGFGFGWMDALVYKVGASYRFNNTWTARAGWNYGESVVPDDQLLFNLLAPAILEHHLTLGFTYAVGKHHEWNFSYVHGFKNSQVCEAPNCQTMLTQRDGAYVAAEIELNALGAAYSFRF